MINDKTFNVAANSISIDELAKGTPNDSLMGYQYYLNGQFGLNLSPVWADYTGEGVKIALLDDGFDYNHSDLSANYRHDLDYDFSDNDSDAFASGSGDAHGTSTMGVIGADDNGSGVVGVAFDADMVGYRMSFGTLSLSVPINANNAAAANVDVYNNSWGFTTAFADNFNNNGWQSYEQSIIDIARLGRDGLGTVGVYSAGNGKADGDNVNYHNTQNSPFTIAVGATDEAGSVAGFSTPGASVLVSAPGVSIATTDGRGSTGFVSSDYVLINGTSFSAPAVSGVAALMLEANDQLGYRDVQEILAYSARYTNSTASFNDNGSTTFNGGGMHFSHDVGYGIVDAQTAVRLAETWGEQKTFSNLQALNSVSGGIVSIPSLGTNSDTITIANDFQIEHVLIDITLTHGKLGDLEIYLVSPDGTSSNVMDNLNNGANTLTSLDFQFSSVAHWGETTQGDWQLIVTDTQSGNAGTIQDWSLTFLGDSNTADDVYVFTEEYNRMVGDDGSRRNVTDDDGGINTLNAAAMRSSVSVDLSAGQASIDGQNVTLNGMFKTIIGGDGNDTLTGDDGDNTINGMRGNDTLDGGSGFDTLIYTMANFADFTFTQLSDDVLRAVDTVGRYGADLIENFEHVIFADQSFDWPDLLDVLGFAPEPPDLVLQFSDVNNQVYSFDVDFVSADTTLRSSSIGMDVVGEPDVVNFGYDSDGLEVTNLRPDLINGYILDTAFIHDTVVNDFNYVTILNAESDANNDLEFNNIGGGLISAAQGNNDLIFTFASDVVGKGWDDFRVYLNDGNDTLTATGSNSFIGLRVMGGAGDDVIEISGLTGDQKIYTHEGDDTVILGDGTNKVYTYSGADNVTGGAGKDGIYLGDDNDTASGGAGNDVLSGQNGDDTLLGDAGNDTLIGGAGNDRIEGGVGNDKLYGQDDNDILLGDDGHDSLYGQLGDDTLSGGAGNDRLYGHEGADIINGDAGSDILVGGDGNDTLNGGDDIDRLYGQDGNDTINGDAGNDYLYGQAGNDIMNGGAGVDRLTGGDGDDVMNGDDGVDYLYGQNDNDTLNGGAGNDYLYGHAGNDILAGGDGNDIIYADIGDDIINDGTGFDRMMGGTGADRFILADDDDVDFMYDFNVSENDVLDLSNIIDGYDALTDSIGDFVQFTQAGSSVFISVDKDGGGDNYTNVARVLGGGLNGTDAQSLEDNNQLIA